MSTLIRLTQFSHGGGCGCKIAPALLQQILAQHAPMALPPELLVGTESSDDAAVYQISAEHAIVATTDFFMPIVDDPHHFGQIAATNALSDIYAMGATPLFALAIVGMPINSLPVDVIGAILQGGQSVCQRAGIPIAGGHSIDAPEPIYGLVVIGLVHPQRVKKNSAAQAGDALILTKPLGIGILSAALKKGLLSEAGYARMLRYTTQLNRIGQALGQLPAVHAMTDVTGFGLAGHLLEMCRGARLAATVSRAQLPLIEGVSGYLAQGIVTGASARNLASYGADLRGIGPEASPIDWRALVSDPQTSGGLLVACEPSAAAAVLAQIQADGFTQAALIGQMQAPASASELTLTFVD